MRCVQDGRIGMQRKPLAIIVAGLIAAVALAAIAFGPLALRNLSNPGSNPNEPGDGTGAQPTAFDRPTWHQGDSWTYDVNASSGGRALDASWATGRLTRTVVSADASRYNVSLEGVLHIRWMMDPAPMANKADTCATVMCDAMLENATVGGYSWYRASDLALAREVRTVMVRGSATTDRGIYDAVYTATVETAFEPALDVWAFPLAVNETWSATSNATVRGWFTWKLVGPDGSWSTSSNFTYNEPVRLSLMSGAATDVSTPAGSFPSIPVRMARPGLDVTHAGIATEPVDRVLGLDHEVPLAQDHSMQASFSGTAKNVVTAEVYAAGFRLHLVLNSYHLG